MYDFFNAGLSTLKGKSIDSSFIYIDGAVRKNHDLITRYVRSSSLTVPPDHLIPTIIKSLGLTHSLRGRELVYAMRDKLSQVANAFRLSSHSSFGKPYYNTFLDGGTEVILLVSETFDLEVPWSQLSPIEFLYHTSTNVNGMLGDGDGAGMGVIKINLPMLAHQYQEWRSQCSLHQTPANIYQFSVKYPILNSVQSYLDVSQFNRIYYRLAEKRILPDKPFPPVVPTQNIIPQLDRSSNNVLGFLSNKSMTIGQALNHVPLFFKGTALELTSELNLYGSRQTEWFEFLYKLPYLHFGMLAATMSGSFPDSHLMSKLQYEVNAFIGARGLEMLPKQLSLHIIENFIRPVENLSRSLQ